MVPLIYKKTKLVYKVISELTHTIQERYNQIYIKLSSIYRYNPFSKYAQSSDLINKVICCSTDFCADRSAFPEMSATRTSLPQYAVSCRIMVWTCWPSSLVGTRTRALMACSRTVCSQQTYNISDNKLHLFLSLRLSINE